MRRFLEMAGFITIAAALHVSAGAMLLPRDAARGEARDAAAPARLSAGGPAIRQMVSQWSAPPEVQTKPVPDTVQPAAPEEAPIRPRAAGPPLVADAMPQSATTPPPELRPNLPPPPVEPAAQIDSTALPDLRPLQPPAIEAASALTLTASDRPAARPGPTPQPEPRRQVQPEPRDPQRQAVPAKAGQGGRMQASPEATGGGGGISPQQLARIEASWRQQIGACMARSVSRVSGGRGARMAVNFVVGRNGRVQGASLNGSSGDARVDQQVLRAVRRARCPAAPPSLAQRQLSFQQPFAIR